MIDRLTFDRDGWLNYKPDDDGEGVAATRLRIGVGNTCVTRNISKRAGGDSEAVNVSILPLAEFLVNAWWPLLHESLKPTFTRAFQVRHRLDSGMRGYSFPALAICSGGEDSLVVDWATIENPHSTISFLTPPPAEPRQIDRDDTELALVDLVESVLERLSHSNPRRRVLGEAWARIKTSMASRDELGYCIISGRLGLDPYDPESPDLTHLAEGLSDQLLGDVSDAVELADLGAVVGWVRGIEPRLKLFPKVELCGFGAPSKDDLSHPAWTAGEASAIELRARSGFRNESPKKAVDELFGEAVFPGVVAEEVGPNSLTAVVRRYETSAHIAVIAKRARQRRFRACAATYSQVGN
jgi:hypothetical protein